MPHECHPLQEYRNLKHQKLRLDSPLHERPPKLLSQCQKDRTGHPNTIATCDRYMCSFSRVRGIPKGQGSVLFPIPKEYTKKIPNLGVFLLHQLDLVLTPPVERKRQHHTLVVRRMRR